MGMTFRTSLHFYGKRYSLPERPAQVRQLSVSEISTVNRGRVAVGIEFQFPFPFHPTQDFCVNSHKIDTIPIQFPCHGNTVNWSGLYRDEERSSVVYRIHNWMKSKSVTNIAPRSCSPDFIKNHVTPTCISKVIFALLSTFPLPRMCYQLKPRMLKVILRIDKYENRRCLKYKTETQNRLEIHAYRTNSALTLALDNCYYSTQEYILIYKLPNS